MITQTYRSCIEACFLCAAECEHCATECLKEDDIKLMSLCIALDRECAVVCTAAVRLMSMGGPHAAALCQSCAEVCDACAEECERFPEMDHCVRCATICRRCAEECRRMAALYV